MKSMYIFKSVLSTIPVLLFSSMVIAQDPPSAAVQQGALAWDNWTKADSGGH